MAIPISYPGVYIQELPSSVQTIASVATSITAFVGQTSRGPINGPVTITSFADFGRNFGGLWNQSYLGFAVQDFFLNGGNQAIIVRVINGATPASRDFPGTGSTSSSPVPGIKLTAANPGQWGNYVSVTIQASDSTIVAPIANTYGLNATSDFFDLTLTDTVTGVIEQYYNLTVKTSPLQVNNVLKNQSNLATATIDSIASNSNPVIPQAIQKAFLYVPTSGSNLAVGTAGTDGSALTQNLIADTNQVQGLYLLDQAPIFNLLCIPPYKSQPLDLTIVDVDPGVWSAAAAYCQQRLAFLIIDPPSATWTSVSNAVKNGIATLDVTGDAASYAAVYFPSVQYPNVLNNNQVQTFVPCGLVAGQIANTDAQRGVWKAPAGTQATLANVTQYSIPPLVENDIGQLNPLGINCLRNLPAGGPVIWGARTLQGDDRIGSQWKYIPVRRLALYIEESLYQGTQWVVFEPNDETLWTQIRLTVGTFLNQLFQQGAFQGTTPQQAYFVKCDSDTTTQTDINNGIVNILVGFAPVKPAEFVVISIQQIAGN